MAKADPPAPVPVAVAPSVPVPVVAKADPPPAPVVPKVAPPPAPVPAPVVAKANPPPAPVVPKVAPPPAPVPAPVVAKANPPPAPAAPAPSPVVVKANQAQNFFAKMMSKPTPEVAPPAPEPVTAQNFFEKMMPKPTPEVAPPAPEPVIAQNFFEKMMSKPEVAPPAPAPVVAKVVPTPDPEPTTTAFISNRDRPPAALVAVNEATVEFTAGLVGGVAGFAVAGPAGAVAASSLVNYLSKRDSDLSAVVKSISRTAIDIGNFLLKLESKYDLLYNTKVSLEDVLKRLKATDGVNAEAVEKVEKVLAKTVARMVVISEEYDLWGEATGALTFVGEIVEKTVVKLDSLNKDYAVTDRLWGLVNDSVATAKIAVNQVAKAEEEKKKDGK